jgi:hypothetical protein
MLPQLFPCFLALVRHSIGLVFDQSGRCFGLCRQKLRVGLGLLEDGLAQPVSCFRMASSWVITPPVVVTTSVTSVTKAASSVIFGWSCQGQFMEILDRIDAYSRAGINRGDHV